MSLTSWEKDVEVSACRRCRRDFTLFRRKHHCRLCGRIFCSDCSGEKAKVNGEEQRACVDCFAESNRVI